MSDRQYTEQHSYLEKEYLDKGYSIKEKLEGASLTKSILEMQLAIQLRCAYARIPEEYWRDSHMPVPHHIPMRVPRVAVRELESYLDNADSASNYGLGLTLLSEGIGYKTQSLYTMATKLCKSGYKCFIIHFDELVYFLKDAWNDGLIKFELSKRLREVSFFFLTEIPSNSDVSSAVMQDLLGTLELRLGRNQPCIFSANIGVESMSDISTNSLCGRLLLPFVRANKPMIMTEIGNVDKMYEDKWRIING